MKRIMILLCVVIVTAINVSAQRHEVTDYVDNYYDADGNRHGYCKLFFAPHLAYKKISSEGNWIHGVKDGIHKNYTSPGVIESQYTYKMGKLIHEKHWDWVILSGNRVRRVIREIEYNKDGSKIIKKLEWNPKTSELVTTYGPLLNGKGYFSTSIYPLDGEDLPRYSEKYNGNDTTYTWFDKSKSILAEKTIIEKTSESHTIHRGILYLVLMETGRLSVITKRPLPSAKLRKSGKKEMSNT